MLLLPIVVIASVYTGAKAFCKKYIKVLKEKLDENNDDLMVAYEMVEFTFNALVNELHTK